VEKEAVISSLFPDFEFVYVYTTKCVARSIQLQANVQFQNWFLLPDVERDFVLETEFLFSFAPYLSSPCSSFPVFMRLILLSTVKSLPVNMSYEQINQEIAELDELYRTAYSEREQVRRRYVDLFINLIQLAKIDDGALSVLIRRIRSESATREALNSLVVRWVEGMD